MEKPSHAGVIFPLPVIYLAALALTFLLNWLQPLPTGGYPFVFWLGALLFVLGLGVNLWGAQGMIRARTPINPYRPVTGVVTDGAFRLTRNPLYLGLHLIFLGTVLMLNLLWGLVVFLPLALVIHYGVIRREERHLAEKFGMAYRDYCGRVRRYF